MPHQSAKDKVKSVLDELKERLEALRGELPHDHMEGAVAQLHGLPEELEKDAADALALFDSVVPDSAEEAGLVAIVSGLIAETREQTIAEVAAQLVGDDIEDISHEVDLRKWCKDLVEGVGGLRDYYKHEMGGADPEPLDVVQFTIRALGNVRKADSQAVLDAIAAHREHKAAELRSPTTK